MAATHNGARKVLLTPDEIRQIKAWHDSAHEHEVAHDKISTRNEMLGITFAVATAVLGIFSATVWTVDMADLGVPSQTIKWVATLAGFAVAALVAIKSAAGFETEAKKHEAKSARFGKVKASIEDARADGEFQEGMAQADIRSFGDALDAAKHWPADDPLNASGRMRKKGRKRAVEARWAEELVQ